MNRPFRRLKFSPAFEPLEDREVPAVFIVNSYADDGVGSANVGDLRYVLNRANQLNSGTIQEPDIIKFEGVTLSESDHTIRVGTGAAGNIPLPAIRDKVIIDGTSVIGFDQNIRRLVTIDGSALQSGNGFLMLGGHSVIMGLEIVNFPGHGILVNSSHNLIGGDEVGVDPQGNPNNPTGRITVPPKFEPNPAGHIFVRPPEGNVISGNGGDGVRIANGANNNLLEGNFIGVAIDGTTDFGNAGNGVLILNSKNNQLLGTTPPDQNNPFVFYNVISGNDKNGLEVRNSNNTTIYANFFGLGADDFSAVGNTLNGVLITGTSADTKFGGNIPLGNVTAANGLNGLEISGSASRTLSGNTFAGIAAFQPTAVVPNGRDGVLITAKGVGGLLGDPKLNTWILTNQAGGNVRDGVHIGGVASGVRVSQTVIGTDTEGTAPAPNGRDGIAIDGFATDIQIGGFAPSAEGKSGSDSFLLGSNLISGNTRNGISIQSGVKNVRIFNSYIGTDHTGTLALGNGANGIYLNGISGVQIGQAPGLLQPRFRNLISFNGGNGILIRDGTRNSILGNSIHDNGRVGINLVDGANRDQIAPVLTSATVVDGNGPGAGTTLIAGFLNARPNTAYQVEFFSSSDTAPGNGENFLGFLEVTTDANGFAKFKLSGFLTPDPENSGLFSATATDPTGNTSRFSLALGARHIV